VGQQPRPLPGARFVNIAHHPGVRMNKLAIGLFAALTFSGSALAADMAVKARPIPMPVEVGYNWTGFYVGLNGGYSWGRANTTIFPNSTLATPLRQDVNGGVFGGQIGYNWQIDRSWVIGLEADAQWTGERGSRNDLLASIRVPTPGNDFNIVTTTSASSEWKLPWFATFRGRAGFLADPSLLLYGTGGLAVGEVKFATQTTRTAQLFGPGSTGTVPQSAPFTVVDAALSDSRTRVGWTVGAGLEKKFTPNWSAKLEYLYVDFGRETYFGGTANAVDVSFHDHIIRGGFNYAFTAGPVVARY
jgi:outer membrane immunogenic protein